MIARNYLVVFFNQIDFGLDLDIGWSREDLEGDGVKSQDAQTTIQQNYVKADIYYQTLNVRAIREEKKYSVRTDE